jgi:lipoprotein-anchoring transpeptidase ErfK/SrfK
MQPVMKLFLPIALLLAGCGFAAAQSILANSDEDPYRIVTVQVLLARQGFSSGLMDNRGGARTRGALADFMEARGLASEEEALESLKKDDRPVMGSYVIQPRDIAAVGRSPKDWEEASRVPSMAYESVPELLSEAFCISDSFLKTLNPAIEWGAVTAGVQVAVLNWQLPPPIADPDHVEIDPNVFRLRVYDTNSGVLLSFPCSVARDRTRIPAGELKMAVFAPNPDYTFNPANYPESARAREIGRSLILPPGPNNPVGVYWIGLSRPGFGIHGTPHPETIGSMESHGCFRLMNRDVQTLSRFVRTGLPVRIHHPAPPVKTEPANVVQAER